MSKHCLFDENLQRWVQKVDLKAQAKKLSLLPTETVTVGYQTISDQISRFRNHTAEWLAYCKATGRGCYIGDEHGEIGGDVYMDKLDREEAIKTLRDHAEDRRRKVAEYQASVASKTPKPTNPTPPPDLAPPKPDKPQQRQDSKA